MKLQEFLSFRQACFICNSPIVFKIKDWTDCINPITMSAHIVSGTKMLKFSHKKISIFINPDTNNYTIYPNSSKQLKLALEGYCKSNQTHHCFDSQEVSLQYNEKTWSEFPSIEAKETIYINKGQIFSIVNSFKERKTTIIIKESNPIVIPIVNMNESSIEQLSDKLKVYLTFS